MDRLSAPLLSRAVTSIATNVERILLSHLEIGLRIKCFCIRNERSQERFKSCSRYLIPVVTRSDTVKRYLFSSLIRMFLYSTHMGGPA